MKLFLTKAALIAALALPTFSYAQEGEGRRLALLAFASVDRSERGFVDMGEYTNFGSDVFASMDYDESEKISLQEFLNWDYGMLPLAQEVGREDAYETALRVVFAFWDRNGDKQISKTEHRQTLIFDFQRADVDNDAILTESEFTSGLPIMVAMRAAINPEPVE